MKKKTSLKAGFIGGRRPAETSCAATARRS